MIQHEKFCESLFSQTEKIEKNLRSFIFASLYKYKNYGGFFAYLGQNNTVI